MRNDMYYRPDSYGDPYNYSSYRNRHEYEYDYIRKPYNYVKRPTNREYRDKYYSYCGYYSNVPISSRVKSELLLILKEEQERKSINYHISRKFEPKNNKFVCSETYDNDMNEKQKLKKIVDMLDNMNDELRKINSSLDKTITSLEKDSKSKKLDDIITCPFIVPQLNQPDDKDDKIENMVEDIKHDESHDPVICLPIIPHLDSSYVEIVSPNHINFVTPEYESSLKICRSRILNNNYFMSPLENLNIMQDMTIKCTIESDADHVRSPVLEIVASDALLLSYLLATCATTILPPRPPVPPWCPFRCLTHYSVEMSQDVIPLSPPLPPPPPWPPPCKTQVPPWSSLMLDSSSVRSPGGELFEEGEN